jgi:hypothetical protein
LGEGVAASRQSAANRNDDFSDDGFLPKAVTPSSAKPGPGEKTSETVIQKIFDELPAP